MYLPLHFRAPPHRVRGCVSRDSERDSRVTVCGPTPTPLPLPAGPVSSASRDEDTMNNVIVTYSIADHLLHLPITALINLGVHSSGADTPTEARHRSAKHANPARPRPNPTFSPTGASNLLTSEIPTSRAVRVAHPHAAPLGVQVQI